MPLDPFYSNAIMGFEGFAPTAGWDYKQYTNGYGTKAQYPGETIDQDTAKQRFDAEIAKAGQVVESIAPNAPPGVKAALTSLTFNAGSGWTNSGLGEMVKTGDWQGAAQRFQEYNKAGGQVNPGLVNRRTQEAQWFMGGAPVQTANANPGQPLDTAPQAPQRPLPPQPLNLAQGMPAFPFSPQAAPQQAAPLAPTMGGMQMPSPQIQYFRPDAAKLAQLRSYFSRG